MPAFTVRLEDQAVRVGLNKFVQAVSPLTREAVRAAMKRAKERSTGTGGTAYPVGERGYARTGALGNSTFVVEYGLSFRIESNAYSPKGKAYSGYVIGNADGFGQARIHAGFWLPLRQSVDEQVHDLTTGKLEGVLQAEIARDGLA